MHKCWHFAAVSPNLLGWFALVYSFWSHSQKTLVDSALPSGAKLIVFFTVLSVFNVNNVSLLSATFRFYVLTMMSFVGRCLNPSGDFSLTPVHCWYRSAGVPEILCAVAGTNVLNLC